MPLALPLADALLPAPLSQRCRDAMLACCTRPSRLQQSVGTTLAELYPGFEEEALEPSTGYSLDLALPSRRVAVEVDGPTHFLLTLGSYCSEQCQGAYISSGGGRAALAPP